MLTMIKLRFHPQTNTHNTHTHRYKLTYRLVWGSLVVQSEAPCVHFYPESKKIFSLDQISCNHNCSGCMLYAIIRNCTHVKPRISLLQADKRVTPPNSQCL